MHGLARDTAILIAERGVRLLIGLLVAMCLARALGPADYGLYSYALSLVVLSSFLGQAGLEAILVRELVNHREAQLATLSAAFVMRLIGGLCAAVLAVVAASLSSTYELPATSLVLLISCSGVLQASYVLDAYLQSHQAFRASSTAKTIAITCAGLARVAAAMSSAPLVALAAVTIAESALTGWLLWIMARGLGLSASWLLAGLDRKHVLQLWQAARPMLISSLGVVIYARADVVLLGQLYARSEVGLYSAASALSEAFYLVPVALMQAAAPRLSSLHLRDDRAFQDECMRLVRLCSLAGLAIAIAVSLLATPIVTFVYGPAFTSSPRILAVHAWSTWMVFVSVASEPWYVHRKLSHHVVRKTILAALVNLALNVLLIPRCGGVGAAIATVVSYAVSAFGSNVLWHDTRDLFWLQLRAMLPLTNLLTRRT